MAKKKTKADLPPWMGGKGVRKDRNRRSLKQERERAEEVDGRTQAGSGSSRRAPQDVVAPEDLEQLKFTDKDSIRITADDLIGLRDDALRSGREPTFLVDFSKRGIRLVCRVERIPRRR